MIDDDSVVTLDEVCASAASPAALPAEMLDLERVVSRSSPRRSASSIAGNSASLFATRTRARAVTSSQPTVTTAVRTRQRALDVSAAALIELGIDGPSLPSQLRKLLACSITMQTMGERIAYVAAAIMDQGEFSRRARRTAEELGPAVIPKSRAHFFRAPPKADELRGTFERIGEWLSVCQAAIFEIWFHLGAAALTDLRSVAFGDYDWTQANATEVLCRLAMNGIEPEHTAEQIAQALPGWRYEQVMRVCEHIAALTTRSGVLQRAYDDLVDHYRNMDVVGAFELVSALAMGNPDAVKTRYLGFLRDLMNGIGLEDRFALRDGQVVALDNGKEGITLAAVGGPGYPPIDDYHCIRAALLLYQLAPHEEGVRQRLQRWTSEHADAAVRAEIRRALDV